MHWEIHKNFNGFKFKFATSFKIYKCKNWLGAGNIAPTDFLYYTVLSLFGHNASLLAIYIGTIKICGKYIYASQSEIF